MYQIKKIYKIFRVSVRVMRFNPTFNNISVISWLSVLLMEETGVPRENHQPVASQLRLSLDIYCDFSL
jgi:hypothetical protein